MRELDGRSLKALSFQFASVSLQKTSIFGTTMASRLNNTKANSIPTKRLTPPRPIQAASAINLLVIESVIRARAIRSQATADRGMTKQKIQH